MASSGTGARRQSLKPVYARIVNDFNIFKLLARCYSVHIYDE